MLVVFEDAQLQTMTRVTVSPIDISEQLLIYDNIYIPKYIQEELI